MQIDVLGQCSARRGYQFFNGRPQDQWRRGGFPSAYSFRPLRRHHPWRGPPSPAANRRSHQGVAGSGRAAIPPPFVASQRQALSGSGVDGPSSGPGSDKEPAGFAMRVEGAHECGLGSEELVGVVSMAGLSGSWPEGHRWTDGREAKAVGARCTSNERLVVHQGAALGRPVTAVADPSWLRYVPARGAAGGFDTGRCTGVCG